MSKTSLQLNLPPTLVKEVANVPRAEVNDVDMPLEQAREAIGRAVEKAIRRSGAALKELGDKGQVSRWCSGENPNIARLWQRSDVRREWVLALAEESGLAEVETTVRVRRIA